MSANSGAISQRNGLCVAVGPPGSEARQPGSGIFPSEASLWTLSTQSTPASLPPLLTCHAASQTVVFGQAHTSGTATAMDLSRSTSMKVSQDRKNEWLYSETLLAKERGRKNKVLKRGFKERGF